MKVAFLFYKSDRRMRFKPQILWDVDYIWTVIRGVVLAVLLTAAHSEIFAQRAPVLFGVEAGTGRMSNALDYEERASALFTCRGTARIPIWLDKLGIAPSAAIEYAARKSPAGSSQSTFQLSNGTFGTLAAAVEFTGNPLAKNIFIEFGAGFGSRFKLRESQYWDIQPQGGFPVLYPGSVRLFPAHFRLVRIKEKCQISYRLDLITENRKVAPGQYKWNFNTIALCMGIAWPSSRRKTYFKGTHRTLQVDDVWKIKRNHEE